MLRTQALLAWKYDRIVCGNAMMEEAKSLPFGAVWERFCETQNVPAGEEWLAEVKRYERDVLLQRS